MTGEEDGNFFGPDMSVTSCAVAPINTDSLIGVFELVVVPLRVRTPSSSIVPVRLRARAKVDVFIECVLDTLENSHNTGNIVILGRPKA